ncbi:MAG TPA: conjugal transfer protein TraF [Vicinamibacterales bacterium]
MSENSRNRTLIAGLLALISLHAANAEGQVGTRASGMAGAFVAVADDATAVYWNPAGVATGSFVSVVIDAGPFKMGLPNPQALETHKDTSAVVALSATAIGLAYYRQGIYGKRAAEPVVTGPESREEVGRSVHAMTTNSFGVSLVQSLSEHVVIGATPKLVRGAGRFAADVDAGVMAWANRFRFGLVARNLTSPEFDGDAGAIELGRELRAGGAWGSGWTGISRVIVSADADLISRAALDGDRRDVAAGVETWWMSQRLGLRGGVRRSTIGDARAAVAAGISAGLKPGMLVEAHVVRGHGAERSWSVGARMTY